MIEGMPDERDWVRAVAEETCDECFLTPTAVPRDALWSAIIQEGQRWVALLAARGASELQRRPQPQVWSPLEYAAHVRDVLGLFAHRVELTLDQDEPDLPWWDHEAAAVEEGYNEQDPGRVAEALLAGADRLARTLPPPGASGWERRATRRGREHFTVEGLARFALHEAYHHRLDAERAVAGRPAPAWSATAGNPAFHDSGGERGLAADVRPATTWKTGAAVSEGSEDREDDQW